MRLQGRESIRAARPAVWSHLTDPDFLAGCTPGLSEMNVLEPRKKFEAVGALGLGLVKVKFKTIIEWLELDEPEHARMKMHGTAPGSAIEVVSDVYLTEASETTELGWSADVEVEGSVAGLASRLIKPVTSKMTSEFFACVKKKIEG